jgi:hypothetical protein
MFMSTLRSLSEKIEKEILLQNNDVPPVFHHSIRGIRAFCEASIDLLMRDMEVWTKIGRLKKLHKSRNVFIETLTQAKNDLDNNKHLSFWHFGVICFTTCFAYEELLKQGKHQSIELNAQSTWNDPNWEVAVIFLNFSAGKLYPTALSTLNDIFKQPDVDASDACKFLLKRISMLSQ